MKPILLILVAIAATMTLGNAFAITPFGVSGTGVTVESYQLDYEVNSVILEVQVIDTMGSLEMTFDREFLDAVYQGEDDEFLVLGDGDLLSYTETETTNLSRTIEVNVTSDIDEVEIFASHLLGKTIDENNNSIIEAQNEQLQAEKALLANEIDDLSAELDDVKAETNLLRDENEELGKTIFNPDNLVKETQVQTDNLIKETQVQTDNLVKETETQTNNLFTMITEQFNNLTAWFQSLF